MKQRTLTGLAVFALAAAVLSGIGNIESRADVVPAVAKEPGRQSR